MPTESEEIFVPPVPKKPKTYRRKKLKIVEGVNDDVSLSTIDKWTAAQQRKAALTRYAPEDLSQYAHFQFVKELLTEPDDFAYYVDRWIAYTKEYQDFDNASDLDDLHLMLMELVIQRKLMQQRGINPNKDNLKEWNESVTRLGKHKSNLATSRDKRMGNTKTGGENSLAQLILNFDKQKRAELKRREEEFLKEETQAVAAKAGRDRNLLEASGLDKIIATEAPDERIQAG